MKTPEDDVNDHWQIVPTPNFQLPTPKREFDTMLSL